MRRAAILLTAALCLFAETGRDAYRSTYKQWREADPNLERDAAAAGAQLAPRSQKLAADAVAYESARKAFLEQTAQETKRRFAWLEAPVPNPPLLLTESSQVFLAAESKGVQRNLTTFAGDPDPGIQELRAKLLRENSALTALSAAIADRDKAAAVVTTATLTLEQTRKTALDEYHDISSGWIESAAEADRESAAWVEYYKLLAAGAQGNGSASTPTAEAVVRPVAQPAPPSAPVAKPSITPVPLVRYTGAWTFPLTNGLYHGPQPEFADLVVHEDNGHATGTLYARFKAVQGDPVLRFDFAGDFTSQRTQVFPLETSDGAKGTIELIPGPAFNLIEVNFQIAANPGKVRMGNMVLVKK